MLIGILYSTHKKAVQEAAEGLRQGLEEQGHSVKIFPDDAGSFGALGACRNIMVGSCVTALFKPRTPKKLRDALAKAPGLAGKRSVAFLAGGGMSERKALAALMKDMEKQGCYLVDQRSFSSRQDAYEFGRQAELKT
ncbi:MAG: hypothetical protein ACOC8N_01685 [Spirochaetota bacterium]